MRAIQLRSVALLLALAALPLTGCSVWDSLTFPPQTRGNKVDPELLAQLVPGVSSRGDVSALIGSPTARGSFDDNTWIYIGEVTKPVIAGRQTIEDQQVVVLNFDQAGVLRGIERKNQSDSRDIAIVARTTPSPGNNASVLQQLLGNVGRFSPAGTGGSGGSALGSSSAPITGGAGSANQF